MSYKGLFRRRIENEQTEEGMKGKKDYEKSWENEERTTYECIHQIRIDNICPNPSQPRVTFQNDAIIKLADSIRKHGMLQPMTVRRVFDEDNFSGSTYEIVAGERRYRAAKLLGMSKVPCRIIDVDTKRSAELSIIENIQRENLNMFEQAMAIASLIEMYSMTQEEVARQLSSSQSYVANKLRLLKLTVKERDLLLKYNLTERHARALLKLDDLDLRLQAIEHISRKGLNVARSEEYIEELQKDKKKKNSEESKSKCLIVLKDIRLFYNSLDKAMGMIKQAGIAVTSERHSYPDMDELVIRIPKT